MSQRRLPDFLDAYLKYTENSESPRSYHTWAGVSVVGGALQRRVWMDWGHTRIFPNQYIVLVGPSGNRKGEPLMIANKLLTKLGLNLVPEAITRQKLIRRMKTAFGTFPHGKKIMLQCAICAVLEEFAVFLGQNDTNFLADLTNWYDSREAWTYDTKHEGTDEIAGVCANILASTAPDWIPVVIPSTAIGGGFTSRILFVVEHRKGRIIEDPNIVQPDDKLFADLLHDLELIYSMVGEYKFNPEALTMYKAWYRAGEEASLKGKHAIEDVRFAGYNSRRATHVKKISMALAACRGGDLVITAEDFNRARSMMESVEKTMPAVFSTAGRSPYSTQIESVKEFIATRKEVRKSEILRILYYDIDARTLEVVEETLEAMQVIKVTREAKTGDSLYRWLGT